MDENESPAAEIKRLRRSINDLTSLLALPAIWTGDDEALIAGTLTNSLIAMLDLDFAYVRLEDQLGGKPAELAQFGQPRRQAREPQQVGAQLKDWLGDDLSNWRPVSMHSDESGEIAIVPLRFGMQSDVGVFVAGARRYDFPTPIERLLLGVAVNQAAIGLREARLLAEQKRVASGLDLCVAQRTRELLAANEDLRREIAERKLIEARLHKEERDLSLSEARKAAIMDSALDCIVTIDHEGLITEFNPAAERIFGYSRDQVVGRRLGDVIVPPSLRERHRVGFERYLATGESRVLEKRVELTAMRADGSEFPVELAITRIRMDGPPCFTGYMRDITERKRSEEKLRHSEAYLSEAQRLSLTGSFGWGVATDEHFWSEETFRIFEYPPSTKVTLYSILDRAHPDDMHLVREAIVAGSEGRDFDYECRFLMPNGELKYLHVVAHRTGNQDGRMEYVGAVQDVTQRRKSEETLSNIRSELAHVSRISSLGALTASIAHEVNQPLAGIINNASTCLRMLGADPPNVNGALETARRTIRDGYRASDVITKLRALFGKKNVASELLDLNEAAQEVVALVWSELQRDRVILRSNFADDLPPIMGDRVQLQQVVLNLIRNAMDAMIEIDDRPRQLTITTECADGEQVRLAVRDSGVGFEQQTRDQLFHAFYTTKSNGMGIGLSVSRSIVESHGGRLWAELNDGPGSTFSFSIPHDPPRSWDSETANTPGITDQDNAEHRVRVT